MIQAEKNSKYLDTLLKSEYDIKWRRSLVHDNFEVSTQLQVVRM